MMRRKFKRKGRAFLCALLFIFMSSSVVTQAVPISDLSKIDMKLGIQNKLKTLTRPPSLFSDDRGSINYLTTLTILAMWNENANNNTTVEFSQGELEPYKNTLTSYAEKFNSKFNVESEGFTRVSVDLNIDTTGQNDKEKLRNFSIEASDRLITKSATHSEALYNKIAQEVKNKTNEEKNEYFSKNSSLIKALYLMSQRVDQEYKEIQVVNGATQMGDNSSGYVYRKDITPITSIVNKEEYAEIVAYGRSLVESDIMSDVTIELTDDKLPFNQLTTSVTIDGEDKRRINAAYLAIFSSSSVYRPFESTVGDEGFMAALRTIVNSDSTILSDSADRQTLDDVSNLYSELKSRKKPIYKRSISKDGNAVGDAERMTVDQFVNSILSDSQGALVTVEGKFKRGTDTDAWSVFTNNPYEIDSATGEPVTGDNQQNTNNENNNDNNNDNSNTENNQSNEQASNNNTNSNTSGPSMEDDELGEYPLGTKLTDERILTEPVFIYGDQNQRATMNKVLMTNVLKDSRAAESLENATGRLLYINPFGDIVLDDDTVIIPGASNATYYSDERGTMYNPNTAAFMNSYPTAALNNKYFTVNDRQESKYIVGMEASWTRFGANEGLTPWQDVERKEADAKTDLLQDSVGPMLNSDRKSVAYIIGDNKTSIKTTQKGDNCMPIEMGMYYSGSEKIYTLRAFDFEFRWQLEGFASGLRTGIQNLVFLVPDTNLAIDYGMNGALFPLIPSEGDNYLKICGFIAKRYFDSMTINAEGERTFYTGRLNADYMTDLFESTVDGIANIAGYTKNIAKEYNDAGGSKKGENTVAKWTNKMLNTIGSFTGVIGVRNAYQDNIFGKFLYNAKEYMIYILVIVTVYIITTVARRRNNFIYAGYIWIKSMSLTLVALTIIPVWLPILVNGFINNTSDDLGYKALYMKQERYANPYAEDIGYDENGRFSLSGSSINLYRIPSWEVGDFCSENGIDEYEVMSGQAYVLDDNTGLFIEGDTIKMNIERLFAGISVTGEYVSGNSGYNYYELKAKKNVKDSMDYYNGYHFIIDNFIEQLNRMSQVYNIPPSQLHYPGGIYKDSFIVDAYVRSDLFLNGGNLDKLNEQFDEELVNKIKTKEMFGENNLDYLGMRYLFTITIPNNWELISPTVWGRAMVAEGLVDSDTGAIADEDKVARVVKQVNTSTQQLMIDSQSQMAFISDENLIKLVSLYALTEFNRLISQPDNNVHPQALNYEELSLSEVMLPILTKDYDRYMAQNQDIVAYVQAEFGMMGLILFSIVIFQSFLISQVMRYSLPILYILLLICLILRKTLWESKKVKSAVGGYLKVFGAIVLGFMLFVKGTSMIYALNDSVLCLIILILLYSVILSIFYTVITALVGSFADFGSSKVDAKFSKIMQRTPLRHILNNVRQTISGLTNRDEDYYEGADYGPMISGLRNFRRDRSVDDEFDDVILDGVMSARHGESYTRYRSSAPKDVRRKNKKNQYKTYNEDDIEYNGYDESEDRFDRYKF